MIYMISTLAPTFVRASLNFSASSFAISAFTTVGALSTNFFAYFCTTYRRINFQ